MGRGKRSDADDQRRQRETAGAANEESRTARRGMAMRREERPRGERQSNRERERGTGREGTGGERGEKERGERANGLRVEKTRFARSCV